MLIAHEQLIKLPLDQSTYLGPARLCAVAGDRVQLEFPDERPWAVLALAYPYQPAVGDIVLAVGQGQNWYVIGILQGLGKTRLVVPADFEVFAPRGRINLVAGKGLTLKAPEVKVSAIKLEVVARRVIERFTEAARWVKETWLVRAGRVRTQADGDYQVTARRINERADEDVRIDGDRINLG